jgi:L-fuculose-phosphate aldolase
MLRNEAFRQITEVGKRLYNKGMVASNDGNLSIRLNDNEIVITPANMCKADLKTTDLLVADLKTSKVLYGKRSITSEAPMHFFIYKERPDIRAVVHAHPIVTTAIAVAGLSLDACILPEIVMTIGIVPLADYATPSTFEVPDSIRDLLPEHDVILLANHGAIAVGSSLWEAYFKMERLEHYAQIFLASRLLGKQRLLTETELSKLQDLVPNKPLVCKACNEVVIEDTDKTESRLIEDFKDLLLRDKET